jgi:hypothetical protein
MGFKQFFFLAQGLLLATTLLSGADAPKKFTVSDFSFTTPAGWEWVETTSSMRKAQLRVPGPDKPDKNESAEVVFFYFGEGNGGGVKANVDRWMSQFQNQSNPKVENTKVGKHDVTWVQVEGTYLSGMPGGPQTPQPNSMLCGAIIENPSGNVFVKMTGPASLVKSSKDAFKKMIENAAQ